MLYAKIIAAYVYFKNYLENISSFIHHVVRLASEAKRLPK